MLAKTTVKVEPSSMTKPLLKFSCIMSLPTVCMTLWPHVASPCKCTRPCVCTAITALLHTQRIVLVTFVTCSPKSMTSTSSAATGNKLSYVLLQSQLCCLQLSKKLSSVQTSFYGQAPAHLDEQHSLLALLLLLVHKSCVCSHCQMIDLMIVLPYCFKSSLVSASKRGAYHDLVWNGEKQMLLARQSIKVEA